MIYSNDSDSGDWIKLGSGSVERNSVDLLVVTLLGGGFLLMTPARRAIVGVDGGIIVVLVEEIMQGAAGLTVRAEVLVLGLVLMGFALHGHFLCLAD